jgi:hypothetical protein
MGTRCFLFLTCALASDWKKYASAAFFALPIGYTFHLGNWQRERYTWKVRPAIREHWDNHPPKLPPWIIKHHAVVMHNRKPACSVRTSAAAHPTTCLPSLRSKRSRTAGSPSQLPPPPPHLLATGPLSVFGASPQKVPSPFSPHLPPLPTHHLHLLSLLPSLRHQHRHPLPCSPSRLCLPSRPPNLAANRC